MEPLKNITTISNEQFRQKAKTWLNNKIILSRSSHWYQTRDRAAAMYHVKQKFSSFLSFPNQYNIAQLAIDIKRHEDLLQIILPVPGNPSYDTACNMLHELLIKATEIIQQYNLQSIIQKQ